MNKYSKKIISLVLWVGVVFVSANSYAEKSDLALTIQLAINNNELDRAEKMLAESEITEFQKGYLSGWLSLKQGDKAAAKKTWEDLIAVYPSSLELGNNLAVLLIEEEKFEEARELLESTLHSDQQVSQALDNLRELYVYKAQQAYQKVFSKLEATKPSGKLLELTSSSNIELVPSDFAEFAEVSQALEAWRKSWATKDISGYLASYGSDFIPADGRSLKGWTDSRKRSLSAPRYIKVSLSNIVVVPIDDSNVRVSFRQRYKSDRFQDEISKVLLFKNYPDGWKIVQEALVYAEN